MCPSPKSGANYGVRIGLGQSMVGGKTGGILRTGGRARRVWLIGGVFLGGGFLNSGQRFGLAVDKLLAVLFHPLQLLVQIGDALAGLVALPLEQSDAGIELVVERRLELVAQVFAGRHFGAGREQLNSRLGLPEL